MAKFSGNNLDYLFGIRDEVGEAFANGMKVNAAGEAIVTGSFDATAIGSGPLFSTIIGNDTFPGADGFYGYTLKLGANGNVLWNNYSLDRQGQDLALDAAGAPQVLRKNSAPATDTYEYVKYNAAGQPQAPTQIAQGNTTGRYQGLHRFIRQTNGDITVLGGLSAAANFTLGNTQLTSAGGTDGFLGRMAVAGSQITGRIYIDTNGNGQHDAGEPWYTQPVVLEMQPGPVYLTGSNGFYETAVLPGTYTITLPNPPTYYTSTTASHTATITAAGQIDSANHFGLQPTASINDLRITLTPLTNVRPGMSTAYQLTARNMGTTTQNADVTITLDPNLTFGNSLPAPSSGTGQTYNWSLPNLAPLQSVNIRVNATLATTVAAGTVLAHSAGISPVGNDANPADNTEQVAQTVTSSFDPNDKQVSPATNITPAMVQAGQWLTYTIRFQNTGTDTAFTVEIKDTLHQNLQIAMMEVLSTSHPHIWQLTGNGLAEFRFSNILLPDSNVNEPASHGFVKYRVKARNTLVLGDQVTNTADIYFDFNPPVTTNTTVTTVSQFLTAATRPGQLRARVYPNPAAERVTIQAQLTAGGTVQLQLTNVLGQVLQARQVQAKAGAFRQELDLRELPKGMYLLRLQTPEGTLSQPVVKQ